MTPIALGVICDLESASGDRRSASFSLLEFAVMDDGTRLTLHTDRGWGETINTTGGRDAVRRLDMWAHTTIDTLVQTIRSVLIPDEFEPPDDHDWGRLVELFAVHGVTTSRDDLRRLPFSVQFTKAILTKLPPEEAARSTVPIDWMADG